MARHTKTRRSLLLVAAALCLGGWAVAAEPAAPSDPFAALHQRLDRSADAVLLNVSKPAAPASPAAPAPQPVTPERIDSYAHRFWAGKTSDLQRAIARLDQLRPQIEPVLRSEGAPPELAAVILVESAARSNALSPAGARGLWQFVPATARRYGLEVSGRQDDRLHTEKSTRAAARYLRHLYERFGSWELAFAAYNAGEDAVARAVARAHSSDFAELSRRRLLPDETLNYVPAVTAALDLLAGCPLPQLAGPARRLATAAVLYATADPE